MEQMKNLQKLYLGRNKRFCHFPAEVHLEWLTRFVPPAAALYDPTVAPPPLRYLYGRIRSLVDTCCQVRCTTLSHLFYFSLLKPLFFFISNKQVVMKMKHSPVEKVSEEELSLLPAELLEKVNEEGSFCSG